MIKRFIYYSLLILLITDIGYSFFQYVNQPLDGDMARNIIPADDVKPIFENPLGINTILNNKTYANPNRFFCHWFYKEYLTNVPILLQNIVDPISSVYLACALAKTFTHVLIIVLLSMIIVGSLNIFKFDFVLAAILISPLFQANGYRSYMGIIDPSTTYTFFYALPCALLILYFIPFIFQNYHKKAFTSKLLINILWIPFAFVICLSGPLNPGIVLTVSVLLLIHGFVINYLNSNQRTFTLKAYHSLITMPKGFWFFLLPLCFLSLYSLFLGRYNSITISNQIPLIEMYSHIPMGLYLQFTQKLGFPILFLILTLNAIIIYKNYKTIEGKRI